ncbi:MAG: (Fe-S)-binding protein, partial [Candidatus Kapabacteria bacterium]|nr:(Fe-S)-binding protein [Candidatus Kapabacteria bacterium]
RREAAYDVVDSCAVDGICGTVCPVGIDTGAMVKKRRPHGRTSTLVANIAARNMHTVRSAARSMLRLARFIGAAGSHRLPGVVASGPVAASRGDTCDLLYVPTCISATFRHESAVRSLHDTILMLAQGAGLRLRVLSKTDGCCGQPLSSQGYEGAAASTSSILLKDIQRVLAGRAVPVMLDASTCASALASAARTEGVTVIDQIGFAELILPYLSIEKSTRPLVIHPGCGVAKQGNTDRLIAIASQLSSNVIVPPSAACCGMGGMHGIKHPEVVKAATADERTEILTHHAYDVSAIGISVNTICESALSQHIGIPFKGPVEVIAELLKY